MTYFPEYHMKRTSFLHLMTINLYITEMKMNDKVYLLHKLFLMNDYLDQKDCQEKQLRMSKLYL